MKKLLVSIIIPMLFLLFSRSFAEGRTMKISYIGPVRTLIDATGQETPFFVPVVEDEFTKTRIIEFQRSRCGKMIKFLNLLKTEPNPEIRRDLLYELSFATSEEAEGIIQELLPMMTNEPEEGVRKDYISCLSSLAIYAGVADSEILKIIETIKTRMQTDASWDVRAHAAIMLVWYGDNEGLNILESVINNNIPIASNTLYATPVTLQRVQTERAKTLLNTLRTQTKEDSVKTAAFWSSYQLGLVSRDEMLHATELVAKTSQDVKARIRAISTLTAIAKMHPEIKENIDTIIKNIRELEQDENVRRQIRMIEMKNNKKEACDECK